MSFSGFLKGKVKLETSDRMFAEDILKFHPELQAFLEEIEKKGWRYLYIETRGTSAADMDLDGMQYKVRADIRNISESPSTPQYIMEIALGQKVPKLSDVSEVGMFRINVSTKSFPRAVSVDIASGIITYFNDAFWLWQKGWESDKKKLSEANEVREVAEWLLDAKKQKLHESLSLDRYDEIVRLLQEQQPA